MVADIRANTPPAESNAPKPAKRLPRGSLKLQVAHGFRRTICKACDFERAVPFSCKGRGFCPSY